MHVNVIGQFIDRRDQPAVSDQRRRLSTLAFVLGEFLLELVVEPLILELRGPKLRTLCQCKCFDVVVELVPRTKSAEEVAGVNAAVEKVTLDLGPVMLYPVEDLSAFPASSSSSRSRSSAGFDGTQCLRRSLRKSSHNCSSSSSKNSTISSC